MEQKIIFAESPAEALRGVVDLLQPNGIWVVADNNTSALIPRLGLESAGILTVPSGDIHKTVETLTGIWRGLSDGGATRGSLVVNLGGGMITDLGGFAAATFKRGVRFVNIPTSLLGAVDAAVGGKTGVNLGCLKNEVGVFRQADAVIVSGCWFDTLPMTELLSGYAEMIKHSLLGGGDMPDRHLDYDITGNDPTGHELAELVRMSVEYKQSVVLADPTEQGLRKALNLGHTAGHALETLSMQRGKAVPHGYAVAWGLVTDLVLSHMLTGMDTAMLYRVARYVAEHYGPMPVKCDDYDALVALMRHDKKNASPDRINFTLLHAPGDIRLDCIVSPDDIKEALDVARDLMGV